LAPESQAPAEGTDGCGISTSRARGEEESGAPGRAELLEGQRFEAGAAVGAGAQAVQVAPAELVWRRCCGCGRAVLVRAVGSGSPPGSPGGADLRWSGAG
jgi:hypothetical protein